MRKRVYIFIFCLPVAVLGYVLLQGYIWYQFYEQQALYEGQKYDEILSSIHSEVLLNDPAYLHNLGNTNYELYDPAEKNIETLLESLKYYSGALQSVGHPDTQFNYDLVLKLLTQTLSSGGESEKPEEKPDDNTQQKQEEESPEEPSEEESETGGPETEKKEESQQDLQINKRDEQYKLNEGQDIGELTPKQQRELDQTIEQLKQEQKINQQFFKKQPQEGAFNNAFDMFFDEDINRGGEKDW